MDKAGSSGRNTGRLEQRAGDRSPNHNSDVLMSALARYKAGRASSSSGEEDMITLSKEIVPSCFDTKVITWNKANNLIVMQNDNGPCPLIALANVLLLRGSLHLPTDISVITTSKLLQGVAECVLESSPIDHSSEEYTVNHLQNVQYALENLHGLTSGLNVNVRFNCATDFEPTQELAIFDVLNIPLFHSWVVFNEPKTIRAVGNLSYNQLTEKIVSDRFSDDKVAKDSAKVAEEFLLNTATQMTYEGLTQLNCIMKPGELGVLFRNNHFSTIYKFVPPRKIPESLRDPLVSRPSPGLFLLVTDMGFLNEPTIVWETLDNIDGDGTFVDGTLRVSPPKSTDGTYTSSSSDSLLKNQQIDHDFLVALSLQNEQRSTTSIGSASTASGSKSATSCGKSTVSYGKSSTSISSDDVGSQPSRRGMRLSIPGSGTSLGNEEKNWKSDRGDVQVSNTSSLSSLGSVERNWRSDPDEESNAGSVSSFGSDETYYWTPDLEDVQVSNAGSMASFCGDNKDWKPIWMVRHVPRASYADRHASRTNSSQSDLEYARSVYREEVQRERNRRIMEVKASVRMLRDRANLRPSASVMKAFDPLHQERDPREPAEDLEAAAKDLFGTASPPAKKPTTPIREGRVSVEQGVRVAHMVDLSTTSKHSLLSSSDDDDVYYQSEEGPDPVAPAPPSTIASIFGCAIL